MKKNRLPLVKRPWIFLLVLLLTLVILYILFLLVSAGILKLSVDNPLVNLLLNILPYGLIIFVLVPFTAGMKDRSQPYKSYLSEIHATNWKPTLQLIILGVSCYLFLALSQFTATLIYRLSDNGAVDAAFISSAFPIGSEFPPNSLGFLVSLISVFEEFTHRGVVLAVMLRNFKPPKAILFSAIGFGLFHVMNLASGFAPIWVAGDIVWATMLGLFYGYITLKSGSLLPAILVHYLGNVFIYPLTAYIQNNASMQLQTLYGVLLTMGVVPVALMFLWARAFTSWWPVGADTK